MSERLAVMRRGITLLELLVAFTLLGAVFAALPRASASDRARRADRDGQRLAADAADLLARDLRAGLSAALLGDTALELTRSLGVGATCEAVVPGLVVDAESRVWLDEPRVGDTLAVWRDTTWAHHVVDRVAAERCSAGRRGTRLSMVAVPTAAPVQILRRVRWVVYRDPDGRAQLGLRDRRGARWSATQPAVGPADSLRLGLAVDGPLARVEVHAALGGRWQRAERQVAQRNAWP
ncbi:MAG: prepilin-type N-terminal cleavage/methylation domain-containing protein [Gemmatimonadaceae bacterium]|nr:prepilin-type N-terminal cleavage/methylation domain-containing protein [Gemmatimonadaceae bacterium]